MKKGQGLMFIDFIYIDIKINKYIHIYKHEKLRVERSLKDLQIM